MSSNIPDSITYPDGIQIIDTFDRPGNAYAEGTYAHSGAYAHGFENKPGKRLPRAGAYAEAGVGKAGAEFSVFQAEAKGPNASAVAEASPAGFGAMATAEVGSVSAAAGPIKVKLGLGVDTGVIFGANGLTVKVGGTGGTLGSRPAVAVAGSEIELTPFTTEPVL